MKLINVATLTIIALFSMQANSVKSAPKVAVIGAGIAGLTAAYRLHQQGCDVEVYETKKRVGGRIFTVLIDGSTAELGGETIPDGGEALNLRALLNDLELGITDNVAGLSFQYLENGKPIPYAEVFNSELINPDELRRKLDELTPNARNMQDILAQFYPINSLHYRMADTVLKAYEGAPAQQLSIIYTETLFHVLTGGLSAAHSEQKEHQIIIDFAMVSGGNALLPVTIAERLGNRVHTGMALTAISKKGTRYQLSFNNGQMTEADIVVLAMPCSVYQHIQFDANVIPNETLGAIKAVQYGETAKILAPYPVAQSFPVYATDSFAAQTIPNYPIMRFFYMGAASHFASNIQQRYAQDLSFLNGHNILKNAPTTACYAADTNFAEYSTAVGYSWPDDPDIGGSYSYIAPGQEELLLETVEHYGESCKKLFAPIDTLFFVGEHASILFDVPGTMEAACESGERASRMIIKAVQNVV